MSLRSCLGLALMLGAADAALADVLWDQSDFVPDPALQLIDQVFPDGSEASSYLVTDVETGDVGWIVESVTVFFTHIHGNWPTEAEAILNVFGRDDMLPHPDDDPALGMKVDVDLVHHGYGAVIKVTASGLDLPLEAGEYWIGLTPILEFDLYGQELRWPSPIVGGDSAWRNPGAYFEFGSHWQTDPGGRWQGLYDASILIEGEVVPAPPALALLAIAGHAARRRRR